MAQDITNYLEEVDSISPALATFTADSGKANIPYFLLNPPNSPGGTPLEVNDLTAAIGQILGYNGSGGGPGGFKMNRNTPVAHPIYQMCYASALQIRGIGRPTKMDTAAFEDFVANLFPYYALYPNYRFDVDFATRPYPILEDEDIPVITGFEWSPPPLGGADPTKELRYTYAEEWLRYCDVTLLTQNDYITAVKGLSRLQTSDNTVPGGADPNGGFEFQGMPRMFLPNGIFKMRWYDVPYRYVLSPSSYLNKFRGMVNQDAFFQMDSGTMFQPGELLYLGYEPSVYTSPIVQFMNLGGNGTFTKFCNIDINFLYTRRPATKAPATQYANYIAAGHNLNPWFQNRNFYYTYFDDGSGNKTPYWFSFPVELLFTNPDVDQPDPIPF